QDGGVAGGGERMPVGAEGDVQDVGGVAAEDGELSAAADVPEPHAPVGAGGGERVPVGAEGDAVDRIAVAVQNRFRPGTACSLERRDHAAFGLRCLLRVHRLETQE